MLAPLFLFATQAHESCPMGGVAAIAPIERQRAAYHNASVTAELVAPSVLSTSTAHRRSVIAPTNPGALFPPTINFVDSDLFSAMQQNGIVPTTLSNDDEFLRRITLDLTGAIPDAATVTAFINDKTPDKRAKKIDELIASDAFNDRWTGKPEDDVLVQYGKPFEVVQLSNGNHLNSYHREIVVSTSSSRGAFGAYGGGHRAQSHSTTIYCDRRFEIDNATLRVVRAIITGSRCDFSQ